MNKSTKYKSIKMDKNDYLKILYLQNYFLYKRKIDINKKNLLGWVIRKAYQDIAEYEESKHNE